MSEIRKISESGEVVDSKPQEVGESHKSVSAPVVPELQQKAVSQALGLESDIEVSKYRDNLETVLEWAKTKTKDHSPEGLKWAIRNLELRLGTPPFGENRVRFLARYAYLQMESGKITKEMEQLEGKHG